MLEFSPGLVSKESIIEQIKDKYPDVSEDLTHDELDALAEKVKAKIAEGFTQLDEEDLSEIAEKVKHDLGKATDGEDFSTLEKAGIYGLQVMSMRDEHVCKACLDHDGTQYTLQEAKEQNPIPHDDCENEECRCHFMPIPDKDVYEDMLDEEPDLSNLYD